MKKKRQNNKEKKSVSKTGCFFSHKYLNNVAEKAMMLYLTMVADLDRKKKEMEPERQEALSKELDIFLLAIMVVKKQDFENLTAKDNGHVAITMMSLMQSLYYLQMYITEDVLEVNEAEDVVNGNVPIMKMVSNVYEAVFRDKLEN